MATVTAPPRTGRLPLRRADLVIRPSGDDGRHVVKDPGGGDAVVEHEVGRVRAGQSVEIKIRALPFETLHAVVEQVGAAAASATAGAAGTATGGAGAQATAPSGPAAVTVYCRVIGDVPAGLRPGMTGDGRIACGSRSTGAILLSRFMRLIRTEFWW